MPAENEVYVLNSFTSYSALIRLHTDPRAINPLWNIMHTWKLHIYVHASYSSRAMRLSISLEEIISNGRGKNKSSKRESENTSSLRRVYSARDNETIPDFRRKIRTSPAIYPAIKRTSEPPIFSRLDRKHWARMSRTPAAKMARARVIEKYPRRRVVRPCVSARRDKTRRYTWLMPLRGTKLESEVKISRKRSWNIAETNARERYQLRECSPVHRYKMAAGPASSLQARPCSLLLERIERGNGTVSESSSYSRRSRRTGQKRLDGRPAILEEGIRASADDVGDKRGRGRGKKDKSLCITGNKESGMDTKGGNRGKKRKKWPEPGGEEREEGREQRKGFRSRCRSGSESNFRNCDEYAAAVEDGHSATAVRAIPFIGVRFTVIARPAEYSS